MKNFFIFLFFSLFSNLSGEIFEIDHVDEVRSHLQQDSVVFINVSSTLIESPIALGSASWRRWIRPLLKGYCKDFNLHDGLSLYIAKRVPYVIVEPGMVEFVENLQNREIASFAMTEQGREKWYFSHVRGIDQFIYDQLQNVGIDFTRTQINEDRDYHYNGIIFASHASKGETFRDLLNLLLYEPSVLIFIDDKLKNVKSMERTAEEIGISFKGFWYRHAEKNRQIFNKSTTIEQLDCLVTQGKILSDQEAKSFKKGSDYEFFQLLKSFDLKQFKPRMYP